MNIGELLEMQRFDLLPHLAALAVAYFLALPLGWNREKEERNAGIRTFPLVAVASCGFIQATEGFAGDSPEAMARVVAGVITGMGFICGGAILHHENSVKGTATATSLWITGALGASVGLGNIDIALMLAIVGFVTLYMLAPLKKNIGNWPGDQRDGE